MRSQVGGTAAHLAQAIAWAIKEIAISIPSPPFPLPLSSGGLWGGAERFRLYFGWDRKAGEWVKSPLNLLSPILLIT